MRKTKFSMDPVSSLPDDGCQWFDAREFLGPVRPVLRFTAAAWAKLHFFCHRGDVEIGGFGVASPEDLILVREFATVKQKVSAASVAFEDDAVAEFFEAQVDLGLKPDCFARIWCHTHPGDLPFPSSTDEATFERVFGGCDWAVMFILARGGRRYTRLRFRAGPGGQFRIPVKVDFSQPFEASAHAAWEKEHQANIQPEKFPLPIPTGLAEADQDALWWDQKPWNGADQATPPREKGQP